MDDFLEQVAMRRRQGPYTLLYYMIWMVIILFALYAAFSLSSIIGQNENGIVFNWISLVAVVIFGGGAFLLWRASDNCRVEYDYTFTNGTLDVSKVLNNKRRRYLTALEMKEVIRCGPATGPAFQKALNERDVKRHNWFVNRDANLYFFLFQKKGAKHLSVMELSDEMVALIRSKGYLQRGVWYEADGKQNYGASIS